MTDRKETIGVKIPVEWKAQIKEVCEQLNITPSEWLLSAIADALGKPQANSIHSIPERVAALEKKLTRLAN